MHTDAGCTIAGTGASGTFGPNDCNEAVNGNSGCGFTASSTATPYNYGDSLNSIGGGVYATEWTNQYVRIWFFPRSAIPASITSGSPNIGQFGTPAAMFQGSCSIDSHFNNHSIIINTDFCGAYAGNVYSQYQNCPQSNASLYPPDQYSLNSCVDFVGNNPQNFTDAYWQINSLKVYQMPNSTSNSVASMSASLSSVTPASTLNSINMGMGQSLSSMSSVASYTGPLSTGIPTTVGTAAPSSTSEICPVYNLTVWTDYKGNQYKIGCGYTASVNSPDLAVVQGANLEACLEACDGTNGCYGADYNLNGGVGFCYLKGTAPTFSYNGVTNGAIRVGGAAVVSTSSAASPGSTFSADSATCPSANGSVVVDENLISYTIYCAADTLDLAVTSQSVDGPFDSCFDICDATTGCVAFTYVGQGSGICYLKNTFIGTKPGAESYYVVGVQHQVSPSTYSFTSYPAPTSVPGGPYNYQSSTIARSTTSVPSTSPINTNTIPRPSTTVVAASSAATSSFTTSNVTPNLVVSSPATQASSSSAASSSAACTAPSPGGPACGSNFKDGNGNVYSINCCQDNNANSYESVNVGTQAGFTYCFGACDASRGCVGFTYLDGYCYLKSSVGQYYAAPSSVIACFLVSAGGSPAGGSSSLGYDSSSLISASSSLAGGSSSASEGSSSLGISPPSASPLSESSTVLGYTSVSASSAASATAVAPPCPQSTDLICEIPTSETTCSSNMGATYQVTCGTEYVGKVIDTTGVTKRALNVERATEPNFQACQGLCDRYPQCVGIDYAGTTCTLLSQITGTLPAYGNVGAIVIQPAPSSTSLAGYVAPTSAPSVASSASSGLLGRTVLSSYNGTLPTTITGQSTGSMATVTSSESKSCFNWID